MATRHNPATAPAPFSAYSQGFEVPAGARWLHVSGQVGVTPEGRLAEGVAAQTEQAWRNVLAILEAASMAAGDLVKVTAFLVDPAGVPVYREIRDRLLDGAEPASTMLLVSGLASPDWLVEIEAVAARAG